MRSTHWILGLMALAIAGCASLGSRFGRIEPGMTSAQVRELMKQGPSRFSAVTEDGYSSWYWEDNEYCVLYKNDRVVEKDATTVGVAGNVEGVQYQEKRHAQCVAPGQTAESPSSKTIVIPGVGRAEIP